MKMNCTKYKFSAIEKKGATENGKKADELKTDEQKWLMGINLVNKR